MVSPSPVALDGSLGVFEIASVLATWLFGIETLQTFNYYSDFPKDPKVLKALVGGIWLLELGHTISGWHGLYGVTVTFYGQIEHWLSPPPSLAFQILFHACIALAVQLFFVYRVRVLSKQWFIPVLCCVLLLVAFVFGVLLCGQLATNRVFSIETQKLSWEITFASSIGPAVDMIIAASLVYHLWHRKTTHFQQTNRIVDTIILWTLETTLLTTASGIMQLILFLTRRHDLSWEMFFLIQAKLFSNSMLASLNGRKRFRSLDGDSHVKAWSSTDASANMSNMFRMQHTSELYGDTGFRSTVGKNEHNGL
ncbi:Saposin B-type domain-containing protein [Mycena venus]|uniref:Saposin B-type domain-containing protein n=1 Tax=Mycena venus TaxID=2733690 RepID=A0A8H6X3J0_9AGAR|nr:Saposin B-type domain-containing protein [Mycena venus]